MESKTSERRGTRGRRRVGLAVVIAALFMAGASPVMADEYDSSQAAHPVRVVAYLLHPVGVFLDYVLVRPAHWLISQEPMKTIFGHED